MAYLESIGQGHRNVCIVNKRFKNDSDGFSNGGHG